MKFHWPILIVYDIGIIIVFSIDVSPEINAYCREKDRLITSEESDEYLLATVELNTTVKLQCRFCNDDEEKQSKIWYYQDRYQIMPKKEVELGMDNNMSYNRIHVTFDLSLIIKDFSNSDAGIYRCHGEEGQEEENKFNYRIEPIFKDKDDTSTERGNITLWERYREINLLSVTTRFAISKMTDLVEIREEGIMLEVVSEWGPWSPCEKCIHKRGFRYRRGFCRLKRQLDTTVPLDNDSIVVKFFSKSLMLPCKSMLLQDEFPSISSAIRYLPEFILEEPCKNCPKVVKMKKKQRFRYRKRYVLAEGTHLTISCPESSLETQVEWKKDSITLEKGAGRSFRKKDLETRVIVDTFSTLYLIDVSQYEQGNYTCYVDNVNMMQVKVIVVSKARLLTHAFFRHLEYLGFIILLTFFCYCGGLVLTFRRRHTFKVTELPNENSQLIVQETKPLVLSEN